jgi:hypothetical protein
MTHYYALLSMVYMMIFVMLFDRTHWRNKLCRFMSGNLLGQDEVTRLQAIWAACQE